VKKGRYPNRNGSNNGKSKLNADSVRRIRETANQLTRAEAAKIFNVCPTTISAVLNKVVWGHVV